MSTAKITVKLLGSCAEIVIGRLTQEQYVYWIEHEDELKEYGFSSSTQNKIEGKFHFLKEYWYSFDSEVHISGPYIEECRLEINIVNDDGENKNIEYNSITLFSVIPSVVISSHIAHLLVNFSTSSSMRCISVFAS